MLNFRLTNNQKVDIVQKLLCHIKRMLLSPSEQLNIPCGFKEKRVEKWLASSVLWIFNKNSELLPSRHISMIQPQFRGLSHTPDICQVDSLIPKGVSGAGCTEVLQLSDCSECCLGLAFLIHRWKNRGLPERIMVCLQRKLLWLF